MKVEGGCHCGRFTYEAEIDPLKVGMCHCTDCQTLTGSAFRVTVAAPAEGFSITGGAPSIYIKTADSGNKRAHAFCPTCGGSLYACALDNPTSYSLRLGALKQRAVRAGKDPVGQAQLARLGRRALQRFGRVPAGQLHPAEALAVHVVDGMKTPLGALARRADHRAVHDTKAKTQAQRAQGRRRPLGQQGPGHLAQPAGRIAQAVHQPHVAE